MKLLGKFGMGRPHIVQACNGASVRADCAPSAPENAVLPCNSPFVVPRTSPPQAPLTVGFLDLTNFTRRTFWDDQDDVVDLAHAVLSGFIEVVDRHGGFPLGLRGDGLFIGFGGPPPLASAMALAACAFALDAVQTEVNPWLAERGLEHIQARAGLDAGLITFIRTGSPSHSEVNPLGFAANFAAKCEKTANSWESSSARDS